MPILYPSATTYPSSTTWPGTSDDTSLLRPELNVLVCFQDVSQPAVAWNDVTSRVRAFSTSRGRDSELSEVSAGTASVTLENQDRFFEPGQSTPLFPSASTYPGAGVYPGAGNARPMNRIWIREQYAGTTQTLFYGYADSWDYTWPAPGFSDALATVSATDELKVLALDQLPIMTWADKTTYDELVQASFPVGYWRLGETAALRVQTAVVGENMVVTGANTDVATPIIGDPGRAMGLSSGAQAKHTEVQAGDAFDLSGSQDFGLEFWFKFSAATLTERTLIQPPFAGAGGSWDVKFTTSSQIKVEASDVFALRTVTSGALLANTWYYISATTTGGNLFLYVNSVAVASTTWVGPLIAGVDPFNDTFTIGPATSGENYYFAQLALYRTTFTRGVEHYTAGVARGYPQQNSALRIASVLQTASSQAPFVYSASGIRDVQPTFMHGQAPLDEIRDAVAAENDAAMFFATGHIESIAGSGPGLIFLDAGYRNRSPWNTIQATFADGAAVISGSEPLPYLDLETDYAESFLYNDLNVTRDGGVTQNTFNQTSIDRYYKRPLSLSGLKVLVDSDAYNIAVALLGRYKDPMNRVTAILLDTSNATVAARVFALELGDRVRVVWSVAGIDQQLFIQKIDVEGANDGAPWRIRLGVSSL